MTAVLRVPCTYQGGKQRIATQIVDVLLRSAPNPDTQFYDLCCGSGAISLELVNRGIKPDRITMLDSSSWGTFWEAVGVGAFNLKVFERYLKQIPTDKRLVKKHMILLSQQNPARFEAEIYPILQACSFGGKQLWWDGSLWKNAFFRDYWEPTATSVRRSPANPMQPRPEELHRRIRDIAQSMVGIRGLRSDISSILGENLPDNAVFYIDPPYSGTTNYGFTFDIDEFVSRLRERTNATIFVSEGKPLGKDFLELKFGGANGGISGNRARRHQEWLTRF